MDNSAIFPYIVYVGQVKFTQSTKWENNDAIYALLYEGSDSLTFSGFKIFCQKNKKHFISKKANKPGTDVCTWEDICAAMELHVLVGDPVVKLIEAPVTFLQLVRIAYDRGIFTDPEGLKDPLQIVALQDLVH